MWPGVGLDGTFDRILVYSVVHYLLDAQSVRDFLDACFEVLRPGGRLLVGDIPNRDAKNRFLESPGGQRFSRKWNERSASLNADDGVAAKTFANLAAPANAFLDDDFVLRFLRTTRERGFESYLLPQSASLPYGNTREDVLVVRRP
jgi:SAM-dependent methyltransferase